MPVEVDAQFIEMPQPLGIYAGDLFVRAEEYISACEYLAERGDKNFLHAGYFLFAHSIELFLKAFLAAKGVDKEVLRRKMGHDLNKIKQACDTFSMPSTPELDAFIAHTNEMNKDFDFRYPSGYLLSMPKSRECIEISRVLLTSVKPIVLRAAFDAQLKFAADTRHEKGKKIRWSD